MAYVFNYVFQKKDDRDYIYKPQNLKLNPSHFITDVAMFTAPILDQGPIGSCLANAANSLFYISSKGAINLSRLQLYMCYRAVDGSSLTKDTGGTIRGCMKAISDYGMCDEILWPYITPNYPKLAPSPAFKTTYPILNYVYTFIIQDLTYIKECLALGNPVISGIYVYASFQSPKANKYGVIPMPNVKKERFLGGHAILLVGYDDVSKVFKFQNSWGTKWGDSGYGYIPYNYITSPSLASDLCTVSFNL